MLTLQNIDRSRWILATIVESGNCRFWGRDNFPVQPLLSQILVGCCVPHPAHPLEAIETQDPIALSIFIFSLLY